MSPEEIETVVGELPSGGKAVWRQPTVTVLDAWEAEAQDGTGSDSSGFLS